MFIAHHRHIVETIEVWQTLKHKQVKKNYTLSWSSRLTQHNTSKHQAGYKTYCFFMTARPIEAASGPQCYLQAEYKTTVPLWTPQISSDSSFFMAARGRLLDLVFSPPLRLLKDQYCPLKSLLILIKNRASLACGK
jgi:hypothetical protein